MTVSTQLETNMNWLLQVTHHLDTFTLPVCESVTFGLSSPA